MKKKEFHFPILEKKNAGFPEDYVCPWCRKRRVLEPHSFVMLYCGALASMPGGGRGAPTRGLRGYLNFSWQDAPPPSFGMMTEREYLNKYPNTGYTLHIARDVHGGACDMAFCSISCTREFLNYCLDEFESKVKKLKAFKKTR